MSSKNQNGITLIALIITIIVMLILVGVTVSVALNGGLFTTAKQATNQTQLEADKEQLLELAIGAIGTDGKVDPAKLKAAVQADGKFTESEGIYTSVKSGNKFTVSDYGTVTQVTAGEPTEPENPETPSVAITPSKETYTVGEEVQIGDEHFYVIADDTDKVTLLAKYNLNKAGTAQQNATYSETAVAFSSTNYWWDAESKELISSDLNTLASPAGEVTAVTKAKAYGTALGGTGRLMTYEEADSLDDNYDGIIYGTNIEAEDGYLYYWVGYAYYEFDVWIVHGYGNFVNNGKFDLDFCGVRPVVEISKSAI